LFAENMLCFALMQQTTSAPNRPTSDRFRCFIQLPQSVGGKEDCLRWRKAWRTENEGWRPRAGVGFGGESTSPLPASYKGNW